MLFPVRKKSTVLGSSIRLSIHIDLLHMINGRKKECIDLFVIIVSFSDGEEEARNGTENYCDGSHCSCNTSTTGNI